MGIQIAPSLLAADFTRIADEVAAIRPPGGAGGAGGADWLHVDVMDNHFVPNITLGLQMVEAIHAVSTVPLDCHLMIDDPDRHALAYAQAGAGSVTFHVEAAAAPVRLARALRAAGVRAGMALRPATGVEPYEDLLPELDMLLLMTVEPGFGGQAFLDVVLPKVRRARAMIDRFGGEVWLQVDGGVSLATVERVAEAGADMLVAGTAVYSADDPVAAIEGLRRLAAGASGARGTLESQDQM
jgi:ribulose-phosphate 3-epimerase